MAGSDLASSETWWGFSPGTSLNCLCWGPVFSSNLSPFSWASLCPVHLPFCLGLWESSWWLRPLNRDNEENLYLSLKGEKTGKLLISVSAVRTGTGGLFCYPWVRCLLPALAKSNHSSDVYGSLSVKTLYFKKSTFSDDNGLVRYVVKYHHCRFSLFYRQPYFIGIGYYKEIHIGKLRGESGLKF